MSRFDKLLGVANNLADSFINLSNSKFLHYIESLPAEKSRLIEIDLLKEIIVMPQDLNSQLTRDTIQNYKKWLLSELAKVKIEISDLETVSLKVAYKSGTTFKKYYTCNATIKAKDKEYVKKSVSVYN